MGGTLVIVIIIFGVCMMITLALVIGVLERIEKKLKDIDFGMGKIRQVLERIEVATEEAKDEQKQ